MKKAYIKHVETWKPEIVFDNDYFHGVEIELTDDEHALIVAYDELRKKYGPRRPDRHEDLCPGCKEKLDHFFRFEPVDGMNTRRNKRVGS